MKTIFLFGFIFCKIVTSFQSDVINYGNFESSRKTIEQDDYSREKHKVTTDDGYVLGLQRLKTSGPPVLMMHGLLGSSNDFMVFGREKSLAYSLADQGYDVWMGNNRGNTLSRKHTKLNADVDPAFWDFSFNEMGYFDCPAFVDYILNETSQKSLTFIGHAQGATQSLVMLATRPDYSEKINEIIALSPFAYMSHIPHPILQLLKEQFSLFEIILSRLGIHEFLPQMEQISGILKFICGQNSISKFCSLIPYILGGMDPHPLEEEIPSKFLDVFPAGTSFRNIKHLFQQIKTGHFQHYDYGLIGNMNKYNTTVPPKYDLTNIHIPVNIFYGGNDWLAGNEDIKRLAQELPNSKKNIITSKYFNHYDFFIAKNVKPLLHFDVINIINKYHNKSEITTTSTTVIPDTPATKKQSDRPQTITTLPPQSTTTSSTTHQTTHKPNSSFSFKPSYLLYVIVVSFLAIH